VAPLILAVRPHGLLGLCEGGIMNTTFRLDDLYRMVAYIYSEQNAQRPALVTFAHFVEACGMLTIHDRKKKREAFTAIDALCKALGWYFPLLAKHGVRSAEELIFRKFPYVCSYCRQAPHNDPECKLVRGTARTVDHGALRQCYETNKNKRPQSLNQWQRMFQDIYPRSAEDRGRSTIALFEEIGELAEAVRVFDRHPKYFVGEAADTFSYLMGIANEIAIRMEQDEDRNFSLEDEFLQRYPGLCPQCGSVICVCPSVPAVTVGRMAKELPLEKIEDIFAREPDMFAADGVRVSNQVLERAGGYRGLVKNFPFDRGDANRALIVLCLHLGDTVQRDQPELAQHFRSAAIQIGSCAATPGSLKQNLNLAELLDSIKDVWRELNVQGRERVENIPRTGLAAEFSSMLAKIRVLFVCCSPIDEEALRGSAELRVIKEAIKLAGREKDIEVTPLTAATVDDLRRALLSKEYEILHFSGHSDGKVLVFENADGKSVQTPLSSLTELIARHTSIRCVILNACKSLADFSTSLGPYTIGMDELIADDAAIEFARGFYDALATGKDIDYAVKEGQSASELKGMGTLPVKILKN